MVINSPNCVRLYCRIDLKNEKMFWKLSIPRLSLLGKYTVNGKVLVLPIKGSGDMNITLGEFKNLHS